MVGFCICILLLVDACASKVFNPVALYRYLPHNVYLFMAYLSVYYAINYFVPIPECVIFN